MNRNAANSNSNELLFPNSRSRSDGVGLTDATNDLSLEKPNLENDTILYPLSVKNVKMKTYCDSREVSARAKCRCSSPQRWNKTDEHHAPSCCIFSVKNKKSSEIPSENCEIDRLANDLSENVKLNHPRPTSANVTCTCHADSTKSCENLIDYISLNGVSKVEQTKASWDSECVSETCRSATVCNGVETDSIVGALDDVGSTDKCPKDETSEIKYVGYGSECQMPDIMRLIQKDLSEPYSIYTYRYFIHNWPHLCFLALDGEECVGAIVCKLDMNKNVVRRGYIAMLAVDEKYRKRKIGSNLVLKAIQAMIADDADEVVLETEITNKPALRLYENLGFVRDKRLFRYYLNGVDALRLKLWLR